VFAADYKHDDAPPSCLERTREVLLDGIFRRTKDPQNKDFIEWLAGLAGTGKTTIAMSVCEMLAAAKPALLGASFFFSRQSAERSSSKNVVRTLAYQLARLTPQLKLHILEAIKEHPDITTLPMAEQISKFILEPLSKATDLPPVVVFVFDALDECDREGSKLLKLFASVLGDSTPNVTAKLFATSRLEGWIQSTFEFIKLRKKSYKLHDIEDSIVDEDIRRYLAYHLFLVASRPGRLVNDWPLGKDISVLVIRCGRLFIYAAIVVRYVSAEGASPVTRLQEIISSQPRIEGPHDHHKELDALYRQVLQMGIGSALKTSEMENIKRVAGTVVLLQEPQPVSALVELVGLEEHEVHAALAQLHAVFILPESPTNNREDVVRILHPSFPEFLTNASRCQPEIPDIRALMNERISAELAYACRFWVTHLRLGGIFDDSRLQASLAMFCANQILSWIEVCSILDVVSNAVSGLQTVQALLQVCDGPVV
jgi:hypothetical protein